MDYQIYETMAEFFRVGRYFDTQDAERTRTEQLERQKARAALSGVYNPSSRDETLPVQL